MVLPRWMVPDITDTIRMPCKSAPSDSHFYRHPTPSTLAPCHLHSFLSVHISLDINVPHTYLLPFDTLIPPSRFKYHQVIIGAGLRNTYKAWYFTSAAHLIQDEAIRECPLDLEFPLNLERHNRVQKLLSHCQRILYCRRIMEYIY